MKRRVAQAPRSGEITLAMGVRPEKQWFAADRLISTCIPLNLSTQES